MELNINIKPEDVLTQKEQETVKKEKRMFNEKNYLQARLKDNEDTKTLTIRLLPFKPEGGSPFHKIYVHQIRVNKAVSPSGWKIIPCPVKNSLGNECPFCETASQARILKNNSISEPEKKKYNDVEFANTAREMWIVRCIERGHEDEGVKFWLFSHSKKGDGVYNKIMNIFQRRFDKAAEQGKYNNIFDLNEGKDLDITLTKDSLGKTVINITDSDEKTPLSNDYNLALSWVNDTKKWTELYPIKSVDYMSVIVQGGIPVFSKEKNCYVDKLELEKEQEEEALANLNHVEVDLSTPMTTTTYNNQNQDNILTRINIDDEDDLPF